MRNLTRTASAIGAVGAIALSLTFALPLAANADYAPSSGDVVGVGSDTVQNAMDFLADGDALGDSGFNSTSPHNRLVNFDATADANVRLAYGSGGATGPCTGGTGTGAGSLNGGAAGTAPCVLNPTIVLRAGLSPVQRPNGSGAGTNALLNDTTKPYKINYVRRSSPASAANIATAVSEFGGLGLDSVTIGTDPLAMISTAAGATHAVALSKQQLASIYTCTGGHGPGGVWTWADAGGTSTDAIIPMIPQAGSGTRSTFLNDIGNPTLGSCVQVTEENDPYGPSEQSSPNDAIGPMSGGRLNLFLGKLGDGTSNGLGGYFYDPSCPLGTTGTACTTPLTPSVKLWTTGTPSDGNALYLDTRPLFIYFRDSDVNGVTAAMEPGGSNNWIRTLFYNPCSGTGHTTGCSGGFGPGGAPLVDTSTGQALISAAGILPTYSINLGS